MSEASRKAVLASTLSVGSAPQRHMFSWPDPAAPALLRCILRDHAAAEPQAMLGAPQHVRGKIAQGLR
eukprot:10280033-Lingulodinium_polyedra.AAC.1